MIHGGHGLVVVGILFTRGLVHGAQCHTVLRANRTCQAGFDSRQIQLHFAGVNGTGLGLSPQALLLAVTSGQLNDVCVASTQFHIAQGLVIDGKKAARGAIFWRHIGNSGTVGKGQVIQTGTKELNKFADHTMLTQHFCHRQHQVSCRYTLFKPALEFDANHFRNSHGDRLAQHGSLGFDTTHSPAKYGQTVDHGGMAVGADQRVGICAQLAFAVGRPDTTGQVLQIDLVTDTCPRRHHPEIVESLLPPAEKLITFPIALHFDAHVIFVGAARCETVDHDRVVNDQIHRVQWIDFPGVTALFGYRIPHRRQINNRRHTREVLHQDPRWHEGNFMIRTTLFSPLQQLAHVAIRGEALLFMPQQILQQNLQCHWQFADAFQTSLFQRGKTEIFISLTVHG